MLQTLANLDTTEQILAEAEPNLLRLYLNPHVAQACFCLDRYVRTTWAGGASEDCQSFLANGLEEALSGAIKLARYNRPRLASSPTALILDPSDRLADFASSWLAGGEEVEFLPGIRTLGRDQLARGASLESDAIIGPLVLVSGADHALDDHAESIRSIIRRHAPLVITCVDREGLDAIRGGSGGLLAEVVPDLVVFDDSFTSHAVPFGAFTGGRSIFAPWNRPGKATFHSTTFQPNTISTRQFMNRLAEADPEFLERHVDELRAIKADLARRGDRFRRHYSPALYRLIRAAGFATTDVHASGAFVVADGRAIFDAVGGVACSIRGHNPPAYLDELKAIGSDPAAVEDELRNRLRDLTGLDHVLPAVSGGGAVENALKVALVAQFPRRHVLALKAGFGGKTLLALTGTANPSYKERIDPLYADVHYVDPFAPDARAQVDALLERHEFAVVQLELIQSVGGVRPVPDDLVRHLDQGRSRWGYLLIVDEVQTGMYRTGPFHRCRGAGLTPDLLLLGKGTSDMMFPFALTLYSTRVKEMVERRGSGLLESIERRYGYDQGYKTVLNVLRLAESSRLAERVAGSSAHFERSLKQALGSSPVVKELRVFGQLIGLELDSSRWPHRWLGKRLSALYLLGMLGHRRFPVLAGFCQYERNVLKITPPLNATPDEIESMCRTIADVLGWPLAKVVAVTISRLIR